MEPPRITIIGASGVGKTTLGCALSSPVSAEQAVARVLAELALERGPVA